MFRYKNKFTDMLNKNLPFSPVCFCLPSLHRFSVSDMNTCQVKKNYKLMKYVSRQLF